MADRRRRLADMHRLDGGSVMTAARTVKTPQASDALKPLIAKVQTLRRMVPALSDEDTWRAFLAVNANANGVTSTRAMSEGQLRTVVEALHQAGAPRKAPGAKAPARYADTAQMAMIRALWLELADLGAVKDRSEAALSAFIKRQTRQDVGRLFPSTAASVIEALKSWRARIASPPKGAL